jgi:hypothetical protein
MVQYRFADTEPLASAADVDSDRRRKTADDPAEYSNYGHEPGKRLRKLPLRNAGLT